MIRVLDDRPLLTHPLPDNVVVEETATEDPDPDRTLPTELIPEADWDAKTPATRGGPIEVVDFETLCPWRPSPRPKGSAPPDMIPSFMTTAARLDAMGIVEAMAAWAPIAMRCCGGRLCCCVG